MRKWLKFLLPLGIFTGLVVAGLSTQYSFPNSMNIDGREMALAFTDDNTDEDLIIKSTQKDYYGFGSVNVPFSITNTSGKDQNIKIVITTKDDDWQTKEIKKFMENRITNIPESRNKIKTATGTIEKIIPSLQITETIWDKKPLDLSLTTVKRKDVKGFKNSKYVFYTIKDGETLFFETNIKYPLEGGEFFIEAMGDKGGYGHLDPNNWTYEQKFNTLNTADLNTQDSWSGSTDYDVSTTNPYEGAKNVLINADAGGDAISRTLTSSVTDGTVYFAMRVAGFAGDDAYDFRLNDSVGLKIYVRFGNADQGIYLQAGTSQYDFGTYTTNQWYVFALDFDSATEKAGVNMYNGTSWSGRQEVTHSSGFTAITAVAFYTATNVSNVAINFDIITPTNPLAIIVVPKEEDFQLWDE